MRFLLSPQHYKVCCLDEEQIKRYIDKKPWELIAALICSITDNAIKSELLNLKNKEK